MPWIHLLTHRMRLKESTREEALSHSVYVLLKVLLINCLLCKLNPSTQLFVVISSSSSSSVLPSLRPIHLIIFRFHCHAFLGHQVQSADKQPAPFVRSFNCTTLGSCTWLCRKPISCSLPWLDGCMTYPSLLPPLFLAFFTLYRSLPLTLIALAAASTERA